MVREKAPFFKEDLLIAIRESWTIVDKEYCFRLLKSPPKELSAIW